MSEIDDRPLLRADELARTTGLGRRGSKVPIAIIATLGLVLGGIGAWWWTRGSVRAPPTSS
jgi:hypothetical protein